MDYDTLSFSQKLLGNLAIDNLLKWPQISTKWQKGNRQYTLEARYVIFIKNVPVFVVLNPIVNVPIQTLIFAP